MPKDYVRQQQNDRANLKNTNKYQSKISGMILQEQFQLRRQQVKLANRMNARI